MGYVVRKRHISNSNGNKIFQFLNPGIFISSVVLEYKIWSDEMAEKLNYCYQSHKYEALVWFFILQNPVIRWNYRGPQLHDEMYFGEIILCHRKLTTRKGFFQIKISSGSRIFIDFLKKYKMYLINLSIEPLTRLFLRKLQIVFCNFGKHESLTYSLPTSIPVPQS